MRTNLKLLCTAMLLAGTVFSWAQQKNISGKVTDSLGFPVSDAYVYVEGSDNGVYTDADGNYSLNVNQGDTVKVEFIGLQTKEIKVKKSDKYDIKLTKGGSVQLDKVVAVAYGKQTKEQIVGSVTQIDKETIEKQQVASVTSALQGTASGVNVIGSGSPGDSPTLTIRGIGSINASVEPLIIVDGMPYNGNINSISQDQVESISVLKDAASTSLYGSRGSNGVIIITTKSGALNSKSKVTLTSIYGFTNKAQDLYETVGAAEYMQLTWEALKNTYAANPNLAGADHGQMAADELIEYLGYNPFNKDNPIDREGNIVPGAELLWDTDWENEILNKNAIRKDLRLSFEGGGEKTSYYFGLDYLDQEGLVKTSNFKRYTSRLNLNSKLNDWLTSGVNMSFSQSSNSYPTQSGTSYSSPMQWIYSVANIFPMYMRDENGDFILDDKGNRMYDYGTGNPNKVNSLRNLFNNENVPGVLYNNSVDINRYNFNGSVFAEAEILKNLTDRVNLGYQTYVYDYNGYGNSLYGSAAGVEGRVSSNRNIETTLNFNNLLNYKFNVDKHNFSVDGIFEIYSYKYSGLGAQTTGFLPGVKVHSGAADPEGVSGYINQDRLESYLGRVTYNYDSKYFLEGSFRRDGSTRFSPETRWGNFYSVGGSWAVSKEKFFYNDYMNYLKLKASYGELGNNSGIGYFPYVRGYETGYSHLDNKGVLLTGIVDPMLSWENSSILNIGAEFGFFNNRIDGSFDYFVKSSNELIYDKPLPLSSGNSSIRTNIGGLKNSGYELTLNSLNVDSKNFKWRSSVNLSTYKNEITELTVDSFESGSKKWEVGRSLYDFYIRTYAGIDPNDGYVMWYKDEVDANGNVTRTTTKKYEDATKEYQNKTSQPKLIGGLNNSFELGNFDLNFLFNFSFGAYVYDSQLSGMQSFVTAGKQVVKGVTENRWQKPGDIADNPVITTTNNSFFSTSSRFLFKNDYVRLKAITLGYNLKDDFVNQIGLEQFRIYVQGDNLWTWQSHKGIDPEQNLSGTTNNRAINMKTLSVGVKLTF